MTGKQELGRRERKKLERRELILTCALDLFDSQGFDGTSVEAIADMADVSLRTLYNFFPTKLDLLVSGFMRTMQDRLDEEAIRLTDPPPEPADGLLLSMSIRFGVYASLDRDLILRSTLHGLNQGPKRGGGQDFEQHRLFAVLELRDLLDTYVVRGSLPRDTDVDAIARLLFAAANGEFFLWIADPAMSVETVLDHMRRHIALALGEAMPLRDAA